MLRAIPSSLSLKSSTPFPSRAVAYDPLIKSALQTRLVNKIFLISFILCWVLSLSFSESWKTPWLPETQTFVQTGVFWLAGIVPVVVLRKAYLSTTPGLSSSPQKTFGKHWGKKRTNHSLLVFSVSGMALLALLGEERLFVKSRKHPLYLNPKLLWMLLSQCTLAFGYTMRDVMLDRFVFRLASPSSLILDIFSSILISTLFVIFSLPLIYILFFSFRVLVLPILYWIPLVPILIRPFTGHLLKNEIASLVFVYPITHLGLVWRSWVVGWTSIFLWELATVLFNTYTSQHVSTSSPIVSLVSGVTHPTTSADEEGRIRIYTLHAYTTLLTLKPSQRKSLFEDQTHSNPSVWEHLVRESLVWLGEDYQRLLRRGKPKPKPAPAKEEEKKLLPPPPPPNTPFSAKVKEAEVLKKPIFSSPANKGEKNSPLRNVIDGLASDGDLTKAFEELPELFRSTHSTPVKPSVPAPVKALVPVPSPSQARTLITQTKQTVLQRVNEVGLVKELSRWWTRERMDRLVGEWIGEGVSCGEVIVRVLSSLICASLTEDTYGIVQRDIPQILEAFVLYLDAIELLQNELRGKLPSEGGEQSEEKEEIEKALDVVAPLRDALRESLTDICHTFGDKLGAFVFPTKIAGRLSGFLEYVVVR